MESETLVFMPNGDITLTLIRNVYELEEDSPARTIPPRKKRRLSSIQQTPIDENKKWELEDRELEDVLEDESMLFYAPDAPNASQGPSHPPTPRGRGSDASTFRDRSTSPPASFWAQLKRQQAAHNESAIEDEEPAEPALSRKQSRILSSSHEVQCIVSFKHMILASHVFEKLLAGDSVEARSFRAKGHAKIHVMADFDTMVILLNVIHGHSRKVPRQVTLDELSNIAQLASKFGMTEAVQFFSDTWIDALERDGFPRTYNRAVLQLLLIFHIFDRPEEFKAMTRLAERECNEDIVDDAKDIPIPFSILNAMRKEREEAIDSAVTVVHNLLTRYLDGRTICDASLDDDLQYACDAMILGSLLKSACKIAIWPKPEAPFAGRRFKDLAKAIRGIRIVDVCNRSSRRAANLGSASNGHGLEDEIEAAIKRIECGMDGLELLQYARKNDNIEAGLALFVLNTDTFDDEAKSIGSDETITGVAPTSKLMTAEPSEQKETFAPARSAIAVDNKPQMPSGRNSAHQSMVAPTPDAFRVQSPLGGREHVEIAYQAPVTSLDTLRHEPELPRSTPEENIESRPPQTRSYDLSSQTQSHQIQVQNPTSKQRPPPSQAWLQSEQVVRAPSLTSKSSWETDGSSTPTESYGSAEARLAESVSSVDSPRHTQFNFDGKVGQHSKSEPELVSEMVFRGERLYKEESIKQRADMKADRTHSSSTTYNRANVGDEANDNTMPIEHSAQSSRKVYEPLLDYVAKGFNSVPQTAIPETPGNLHPQVQKSDQEAGNIQDQARTVLLAPNIPGNRANSSQSHVTKTPAQNTRPKSETYQQQQQAPAARPEPAISSAASKNPMERQDQLSQSEKLSQAVSQLEAARAYIERQSSNSVPPPQPEPIRQTPREPAPPRRSPPHLREQQLSLKSENDRSLQQANSSPQLYRTNSGGSQTSYISSKLSQSHVVDEDEDIRDDNRPNGHITRREAPPDSERFSYPYARPSSSVVHQTSQDRSSLEAARHAPTQSSSYSAATSPVETSSCNIVSANTYQDRNVYRTNASSQKSYNNATASSEPTQVQTDIVPKVHNSVPKQATTDRSRSTATRDAPRNDNAASQQNARSIDDRNDRLANNDVKSSPRPRYSPPSSYNRNDPSRTEQEYRQTLPYRPAPPANKNLDDKEVLNDSLHRREDISSPQRHIAATTAVSTPSMSSLRSQPQSSSNSSNLSNAAHNSPSPPLSRSSQPASTQTNNSGQGASLNTRQINSQQYQPNRSRQGAEKNSSLESTNTAYQAQHKFSPPLAPETQYTRKEDDKITKSNTNTKPEEPPIRFTRKEVEGPEEEEWDQAQSFNMRRSKKKFSMRI